MLSITRRVALTHFSIIGLLSAGITTAALAQDLGGGEEDGPQIFDGKAALEADPTLQFDPFGVLVQFEENLSEEDRAIIRSFVGGEVLRSYRSLPTLEKISIDMPVDQAIWLLNSVAGVESVERDYVIRHAEIPNDPNFHLQWALRNIGQNVGGVTGIHDADMDIHKAWETTHGEGSIIAIVDSGINELHEDLSPNMWSNPDEIPNNNVDDDNNGYVDDVSGWDFYDNDDNPNDEDGHGTAVAGIAGARGGNSVGIAGVAYKAELMNLRITGPNGGLISDAIAAVEYAYQNGADVSCHSYTSESFSSNFRNAIRDARAFDHIVVASAGNDDGANNDSFPLYPASYELDNVISVAATTSRNELASFSNIGPVSIDVGAPGAGVFTTRRNGLYGGFTGTSAAAPQVAGVVALVMAEFPEMSYNEVRDKIFDTVDEIDALDGNVATGGLVNGKRAVRPAITPPAKPGRPSVTDLGNGRMRITWADNSNNETRFIIQRMKKYGVGDWRDQTNVAVVNKNKTNYTDNPGLGVWKYRVRTRNQLFWSSWTKWRIGVAR